MFMSAVKNKKGIIRKLLLGSILPVLFLLFWQYQAVRLNNAALVPRVEAVVSILMNPVKDLVGTGSLFWNTIVSLFRVLCGFSFAIIICVPLGLFIGASRVVSDVFEPFIELFRPLCPIAWIPFAMAVFKTTTVPQMFGLRYSNNILDSVQIGMLFIIFYGGLFPVLLNTVHGVKNVRKLWIESAQSLGASQWQVFTKVIIPASLPAIMTGIRVGFGVSWMVIIAAEMLPGSDSGIGYLIIYSYELAEMDILIACMVVIGCVGLIINHGLQIMSHKVSKWAALER